jgi:transcriptional regulator with PAS, ATPase and Fis domain
MPEEEQISTELLPVHLLSQPVDNIISVNGHGDLSQYVVHAERAAITAALRKQHGNRTRTARILGITRQTLLAKMKKYGVV